MMNTFYGLGWITTGIDPIADADIELLKFAQRVFHP
jgi:hypothetical protein